MDGVADLLGREDKEEVDRIFEVELEADVAEEKVAFTVFDDVFVTPLVARLLLRVDVGNCPRDRENVAFRAVSLADISTVRLGEAIAERPDESARSKRSYARIEKSLQEVEMCSTGHEEARKRIDTDDADSVEDLQRAKLCQETAP
jgi:hypothetical protein